MVTVDTIKPEDYVAQRRGDILTNNTLSQASISALQVLGYTPKTCTEQFVGCFQEIRYSIGLSDERKMATLAELWLQRAIRLHKENTSLIGQQQALIAFLEVARHAYAYLFFTERMPAARVLEDRQGQVRDYYNFAVQQSISGYLIRSLNGPENKTDAKGQFEITIDPWTVQGKVDGLGLGRGLPNDLVPASTLNFDGVRSEYSREGVGAELVARFNPGLIRQGKNKIWSEMPFPSVTALLLFPGNSLEEVLNTRTAQVRAFDPYKQATLTIQNLEIPLAANFTAGYGLWLANSGFAQQSLLTMVGQGDPLEHATIYLMQPFDPKRQLVIMLHGLGSSPEAWVNVANEVLGDETLRRNYQIWQVYYPTQLPLAFNRQDIEQAITQTLKQFDPSGQSRASKDITLIGHSMGGVLSRLLVSDSGTALWEAVLEKYDIQDTATRSELEKTLKPLVIFEPLPQVSRAVFIAAPHRGTPLAQNRIAQFLSGVIRLPVTVLGKVTEITKLLVVPGSANELEFSSSLTSIDNLSDENQFVVAASRLPISKKVTYHSIIGNNTPQRPIKDSTDGVVPYRSATLEGAESELIIPSWHSVQEKPEAIVEIRRILHQQIKASP
ncbi:MAG: alpha/beta fold hydrolase [Limnobacter sp.]|nr:alpha/beta fold hydrolase [Limnobacter sp.]